MIEEWEEQQQIVGGGLGRMLCDRAKQRGIGSSRAGVAWREVGWEKQYGPEWGEAE